MPRQAQITVDNQFIGGLKTDFTGLTYPPNSCTDTFNCVFDRSGLVSRRLGIDYQVGANIFGINRTAKTVNVHYWKNASRDGTVSIIVCQFGQELHFYRSSQAQMNSPISDHKLDVVINLALVASIGQVMPVNSECQFAEGDGFLFVFNPYVDPVYLEYTGAPGAEVTANRITIQVRDTLGVREVDSSGNEVPDDFRPPLEPPVSFLNDHLYNLSNQGWGLAWKAVSTTTFDPPDSTENYPVLDRVFVLDQANLPIRPGDNVRIYRTRHDFIYLKAVVNSYVGTNLNVNIISKNPPGPVVPASSWFVVPEPNPLAAWKDQIGNYPSNADVWWWFKDETGTFNPAETLDDISPPFTPAPKGHYILDAFNQDRLTVSRSSLTGIPNVVSIRRPSTGAWFAGRVWYAGINDKFSSSPKFPHVPFIENIYFSQIVERVNQFGKCYQVNDPTSDERFDLLPSDGGVIVIQGTGIIHKLFPIINGLLVFAERGIWFITGSQGIGFTANDYTITKVSSIGTISASSFVDIQGFPMWWNEDGIYSLNAGEQGGLSVKEISAEAGIGNFYADIPLISRMHAKGYFNPVEFKVQWLYRHENEDATTSFPNVTARHQYTRILNLDTLTGAFYPWTIDDNTVGINLPTINGIVAEGGKGGRFSPPFTFKYLTSIFSSAANTHAVTFSESLDFNYIDFQRGSGTGTHFTSFIETGYRVPSQGLKNAELPYIKVLAEEASVLLLQSKWDWTTTSRTGRWSSTQRLNFTDKVWQTTSQTGLQIGPGVHVFIVANVGLPILVGDMVKAYVPGSIGDLYMIGRVNSYSGQTLNIAVTEAVGIAQSSNWIIIPEPIPRSYVAKRVRIRGNGQAVQLRFESEERQPMNLIGWSSLVSVTGGID